MRNFSSMQTALAAALPTTSARTSQDLKFHEEFQLALNQRRDQARRKFHTTEHLSAEPRNPDREVDIRKVCKVAKRVLPEGGWA